jgi:hypothetical protein
MSWVENAPICAINERVFDDFETVPTVESRRSRHYINDLAMILAGKTGANPARKTGL